MKMNRIDYNKAPESYKYYSQNKWNYPNSQNTVNSKDNKNFTNMPHKDIQKDVVPVGEKENKDNTELYLDNNNTMEANEEQLTHIENINDTEPCPDNNNAAEVNEEQLIHIENINGTEPCLDNNNAAEVGEEQLTHEENNEVSIAAAETVKSLQKSLDPYSALEKLYTLSTKVKKHKQNNLKEF